MARKTSTELLAEVDLLLREDGISGTSAEVTLDTNGAITLSSGIFYYRLRGFGDNDDSIVSINGGADGQTYTFRAPTEEITWPTKTSPSANGIYNIFQFVQNNVHDLVTVQYDGTLGYFIILNKENQGN